MSINHPDRRTPDTAQLAQLLQQFRQAPSASSSDRLIRTQLLDELQEAVGLTNQTVTEADVLRRAEQLIHPA
jgi:hypothetical protein